MAVKVPQMVFFRIWTKNHILGNFDIYKGKKTYMSKRILVTGSAGFIGGYLVEELLGKGYTVVGLDNYSKYGRVKKSYDNNPNYEFVEGDATDVAMMTELISGVDIVIAGAAMIGGISYFHTFAYDLLATNERIMAATCDASIRAHNAGTLERVVYLSSSMVFESTDRWPSKEGDEKIVPPPFSSYGFQKLAVEYFARAAYDQYGVPFTICRPFNCVGTGEGRAVTDIEVKSGNVNLAMSHVVPDIAQKLLKGQDPLHILGDGNQIRHYTYGGDLARGIVLAMESDAAINEDFNLSTAESTTVIELAKLMWNKIRGDEAEFNFVSDDPFTYDVQRRIPDVTKARAVLGFEANTSLDQMLDIVIPWIREALATGLL
jgi:nucleoside-diphosphate-sugar epimerase